MSESAHQCPSPHGSKRREVKRLLRLGFQNKAQLDDLYNPFITKTLLSNCNTKVIFKDPESNTAHYLSQLLGEQEVFELAESIFMGAHHLRDGLNVSSHSRPPKRCPGARHHVPRQAPSRSCCLEIYQSQKLTSPLQRLG